ncbi:MAG: hypothetical protein ACRD3F_04495 [Acidobacteriaceae bacterium]
MSLFRFIPAAFLVVGVLPCGAQTLSQNHSSQSTKVAPKVQMFQGQVSPCILEIAPGSATPSSALKQKLCAKAKEQEQTAFKKYMAEKNSACYSIRDYDFETPKGTKFPMLKSYTTCVPAARFEAKNVTVPVTVRAANPKR